MVGPEKSCDAGDFRRVWEAVEPRPRGQVNVQVPRPGSRRLRAPAEPRCRGYEPKITCRTLGEFHAMSSSRFDISLHSSIDLGVYTKIRLVTLTPSQSFAIVHACQSLLYISLLSCSYIKMLIISTDTLSILQLQPAIVHPSVVRVGNCKRQRRDASVR